MEIVPGIHRVQAPFGNRYMYQHLLIGDRVVLMDTGVSGTPADLILPYLEGLGRKRSEVSLAIISHKDVDHFGGNAQLRELCPQVVIAGHAEDAPYIEDPDWLVESRYNGFAREHGIFFSAEVLRNLREAGGGPCPVDLRLAGGESILMARDWTVHVLHTPGHSPGHLSLFDPRSRAVIICDAVLWRGLLTVDGTIAMPPTYTHPRDALSTIDTLQRLEPEWLLTSHYPIMRGEEVTRFLAESREFILRADREIREALRDAGRPMTMQDLIGALDPRLGPYPPETTGDLVHPLTGHLRELTAAGVVRRTAEGERTAWVLA